MSVMSNGHGHVFWLFGLSGAGKSTLGNGLADDLRVHLGENVLLLDGDRFRSGLSEGLGFSDADRSENLRRAAQVARLGVESDLLVIAAFITPRELQRKNIEAIVGRDELSLIHVDTALDACRQRDVKGLYARAAAGANIQLTGVSSDFEAPQHAALRLSTATESPVESAARLFEFVCHFLAQRPTLVRAGS